jgi:hypothetical protein
MCLVGSRADSDENKKKQARHSLDCQVMFPRALVDLRRRSTSFEAGQFILRIDI